MAVNFRRRRTACTTSKAHYYQRVAAKLRHEFSARYAAACVLCLFVFLFALSAKLSLYDQGDCALRKNPISLAKICLNGEKMEVERQVVTDRHELLNEASRDTLSLLWIALVFFCNVLMPNGRTEERNRIPIPRYSSLVDLRRFFRPPPHLFPSALRT